jgi:HSP20 family protein
MFPRDIFAEMRRLQRDLQQVFEGGPSIRGLERGTFPALNVGGTPEAVELYAFAPGLEPGKIDVHLECGVLTLSGERDSDFPAREEKNAVHINERFAGRFRRVISLPDDIDPDSVNAEYRDGVLRITLKRKQATQPRRITIQ